MAVKKDERGLGVHDQIKAAIEGWYDDLVLK
jgi:hypothetical protein